MNVTCFFKILTRVIIDTLGVAKQHEQNRFIFVRSHFFAVVFMFLYFFWLKDIGLFSFKYYMFNSLPVMVDLVVRQCSLKNVGKSFVRSSLS